MPIWQSPVALGPQGSKIRVVVDTLWIGLSPFPEVLGPPVLEFQVVVDRCGFSGMYSTLKNQRAFRPAADFHSQLRKVCAMSVPRSIFGFGGYLTMKKGAAGALRLLQIFGVVVSSTFHPDVNAFNVSSADYGGPQPFELAP